MDSKLQTSMDNRLKTTESLKETNSYLDSVVNLIRFSVLIVDENLNVVWSNLAAKRLLDTGDILSQSGGQLRSANGNESTRLRKFLQSAMNGTNTNMRETVISLRCLGSGRFCELVACRVQTPDFMPDTQHFPAVVLIVSDPEQHTFVPPSILKSLFDLTASERRLSKALLNGLSLDQYALETRISVHTARTHLKSIFRKTDTCSQASLVTLLSRLVPPVEVEHEEI